MRNLKQLYILILLSFTAYAEELYQHGYNVQTLASGEQAVRMADGNWYAMGKIANARYYGVPVSQIAKPLPDSALNTSFPPYPSHTSGSAYSGNGSAYSGSVSVPTSSGYVVPYSDYDYESEKHHRELQAYNDRNEAKFKRMHENFINPRPAPELPKNEWQPGNVYYDYSMRAREQKEKIQAEIKARHDWRLMNGLDPIDGLPLKPRRQLNQ